MRIMVGVKVSHPSFFDLLTNGISSWTNSLATFGLQPETKSERLQMLLLPEYR
jgi:hypothetical protein